jgi:predicted metalloprotease with PDZ domain
MLRIPVRLLLAFLAASLLQIFASAEIVYKVTPSVSSGHLSIEMDFDVSTPTAELQMPSWLGDYSLRDSWETLHEVTAADEAGNSLPVVHARGDTWTISTAGHRRITVRYDRPIPRPRFDSDQTASDADTVHYGFQPIYFYVVGRKSEPCILELAVPAEWKIAVGLMAAQERNGHPTFLAKSYDMLVDNPVTMGSYLEERYQEHGKEHLVALRGTARNWVDRQKTLQMARFVTQIETDFFGEAPYDLYVWHFWVYEGPSLAGGTEHASSTEMHLSTEEGPSVVQGMAHEFFHLWNVKRIRSKPLGPFDYTQLPHTGALWWLEGVTDYYSMLLPYRYGAWNRDLFLEHAVDEINEVRENQARFEVSPYDSSYRISRENPNNYKVDYYPTGWVLGMLFDIELRVRTNGKRSLDDVELALWNLCKNDQPGFEEDEIRRQLVRFGGQEMGPLYDQWVLKAGDLPIEQELGKIGLGLVEQTSAEKKKSGSNQSVSIQERPDITHAQRMLLAEWLRSHVFESMPPPLDPPTPLAAIKIDPKSYDDYTGRYELADGVLFNVTTDGRGVSAGFPDRDGGKLTPVSADTFFYTRRNAQLSFLRDSQGEVTRILWKQGGQQRSVPRVGPYIHSMHAQPDPDVAFTQRVRAVLDALSEGVHLDTNTPGLAPGALSDYSSSGPVHGLIGIRSLDYIASQDVGGRNIERHNGIVNRIVYFKLVTRKATEYLMIYLTSDGLVTDFDYVDD